MAARAARAVKRSSYTLRADLVRRVRDAQTIKKNAGSRKQDGKRGKSERRKEKEEENGTAAETYGARAIGTH